MPTESAACRSTETLPVQSRLKSAGPPQMSWTDATGSTPGADTSIVSVAPNSRASASRDASRSTAMIEDAGDSRAAITAESPTGPGPQRVQPLARAGRDPAGQRPEQRHVGVRVHHHEGVGGADRVGRER